MNSRPPISPASNDIEPLEAVFERIRAGEEGAFEKFYERMQRPLMAYCLAITGDLDAAKDAFHNTVISIYEARNRFRNVNLMGWVFTIARNASRTLEQRQNRRVEIDESHLRGNEEAQTLDADEQAIVRSAIMNLADEFRQVIFLKYFGDMSVDAIAEAEDISVTLVKVRLFRARKQLANVLRIHFESHI